MLTMTQAHHIKYLYEVENKSLNSISKETGFDFRTVKKYVEKQDWNERQTRNKPSKIESVKEIIDGILIQDMKHPRKQRHTAVRIYQRLLEEYPDKLQVKERTVRRYVSQKKKELYGQMGYLPLKHPGGEAQADFGEVLVIEKGKEKKFYTFNLSFPFSNSSYVQLFKSTNTESLLTGLKVVFEYMDRVPKVIWFDNLSSAVISILKNGERVLTDRFQRFALHYGFKASFCNPNSGHEKGNIENKVGYNRRNFFVPIPSFDSIEDFNRELLKVSDEDMRRNHYKKDVLISKLFEEERDGMNELPVTPFEVSKLLSVKANKYGMVTFEKNRYSTAPELSLRELWLRADAFTVTILDERYERVVTHARLYGEKQEAFNWYLYLPTIVKRPNALKYVAFYDQLPVQWKEFFERSDRDGKKAGLKLLSKMLSESDMATATRALIESDGEIDSILVTYHRLTQPQIGEVSLSEDIPQLNYEADLSVYDGLLGSAK